MFNNFVKSMMALCMVTSGWSSNGIDGLLKTSEHKQKNNENSIVQYKVVNIILSENGGINERTAGDDSDINTSDSSEESIKTVDEETQTDEEGSVDRSDLSSSNSSGAATEAAVIGRQANGSWDARDIDSNQPGVAEENSGINACEEVADKVWQLNFFIGQCEKGVIYPVEDAERQVIELIKSISGDLEKVYSNQTELFSDLLVSFCNSQSIWGEREDLDQFKKIIVQLAGLEGCKDSDVDSALEHMISKRDYGYDY